MVGPRIQRGRLPAELPRRHVGAGGGGVLGTDGGCQDVSAAAAVGGGVLPKLGRSDDGGVLQRWVDGERARMIVGTEIEGKRFSLFRCAETVGNAYFGALSILHLIRDRLFPRQVASPGSDNQASIRLRDQLVRAMDGKVDLRCVGVRG